MHIITIAKRVNAIQSYFNDLHSFFDPVLWSSPFLTPLEDTITKLRFWSQDYSALLKAIVWPFIRRYFKTVFVDIQSVLKRSFMNQVFSLLGTVWHIVIVNV